MALTVAACVRNETFFKFVVLHRSFEVVLIFCHHCYPPDQGSATCVLWTTSGPQGPRKRPPARRMNPHSSSTHSYLKAGTPVLTSMLLELSYIFTLSLNIVNYSEIFFQFPEYFLCACKALLPATRFSVRPSAVPAS